MLTRTRLTVLLAVGIVILALAGTVSAAGPQKNPKKTFCPNLKLVCKSCRATPNPPSSSTNPQDTCCFYQVTGWRVCSE